MRARRRPLDAYRIKWQTSMARIRAREAEQGVDGYRSDDGREKRMEVHECRSCFYLYRGRVGGAAMTNWKCGVCGTERTAGSTNTPSCCPDCAREHSLCTYCGGDLEMREGRRKFPTPAPEGADDA